MWGFGAEYRDMKGKAGNVGTPVASVAAWRESRSCRNVSCSLSELFELRKFSVAEFPFPLCTTETGSW